MNPLPNRSGLMTLLLPDQLSYVDANPGWGEYWLHEEEELLVVHAVEKRYREFAAGRTCARLALATLGIINFPVLAGPSREPVWPDGIVGSVTHCDGYCAAAVARVSDFAGVGIDSEVNAPLSDKVNSIVGLPEELNRLDDSGLGSLAVLLFSAKEAIYKAWYPLTHRPLNFLDIEVTVDRESSCFSAQPRSPKAEEPNGIIRNIYGKFTVSANHVHTVAVLQLPLLSPRLTPALH